MKSRRMCRIKHEKMMSSNKKGNPEPRERVSSEWKAVRSLIWKQHEKKVRQKLCYDKICFRRKENTGNVSIEN